MSLIHERIGYKCLTNKLDLRTLHFATAEYFLMHVNLHTKTASFAEAPAINVTMLSNLFKMCKMSTKQ